MSTMWIEASKLPQRYGHDLYANLRALDLSGCDRILVEEPPGTREWAAIRDRLGRAPSAKPRGPRRFSPGPLSCAPPRAVLQTKPLKVNASHEALSVHILIV